MIGTGRVHLVACAAGLALAACAMPGPGVIPARSRDSDADLLVPPGNGTLLQDDITLTVPTAELILKVTPLEEWVVRLTAPDTWSRLSRLAAAHRDEAVRQTGVERPVLFLVSFFSRTPDALFRPEDVELLNRGRRQRALLIRPLTAGWGEGRLVQEQTQLAVYAFSEEIDLDQPIVVEYGLDVGAGWDEIVQRLELERGRARARAGLGPR